MTANRWAVTLGEEIVEVRPFSSRKGLWVMEILQSIGDGWEALLNDAGRFARQWSEDNAIELTRAQAKALPQFAPRPLYDDSGDPVLADGKLVMRPGGLDDLTEEDWERSGHKYRITQDAPADVVRAYLLPKAYASFPDPLVRLMALAVVGNREFGRAAENGDEAVIELLDSKRSLLLDDALLEESLELLVVVAERVQEQFSEKVDALGDRVGKAAAVLGLNMGVLSGGDETKQKQTSSSSSPPSSGGGSDAASTSRAGAARGSSGRGSSSARSAKRPRSSAKAKATTS